MAVVVVLVGASLLLRGGDSGGDSAIGRRHRHRGGVGAARRDPAGPGEPRLAEGEGDDDPVRGPPVPDLPSLPGRGLPERRGRVRAAGQGEAPLRRDGVHRPRLREGAPATRSPPASRASSGSSRTRCTRTRARRTPGWVTDTLLEQIAKGLGLDWAKLKKDAAGAVTLQQANAMAAEANQRQIEGTPTFYVQVGNGQPYQVQPGSFDPSRFRSILDDALAG